MLKKTENQIIFFSSHNLKAVLNVFEKSKGDFEIERYFKLNSHVFCGSNQCFWEFMFRLLLSQQSTL